MSKKISYFFFVLSETFPILIGIALGLFLIIHTYYIHHQCTTSTDAFITDENGQYYEFIVNGNKYTGTTGTEGTYFPGESVLVRYNPENPNRNEMGISWSLILRYIAGAFFLVGSLVPIILLIYEAKNQRK